MTQKHTPTPYYFSPECENWRAAIKAVNGKKEYVVTFLDNLSISGYDNQLEANAEFIVRACNSHYDLISELEYAAKVSLNQGDKQRFLEVVAKARGQA